MRGLIVVLVFATTIVAEGAVAATCRVNTASTAKTAATINCLQSRVAKTEATSGRLQSRISVLERRVAVLEGLGLPGPAVMVFEDADMKVDVVAKSRGTPDSQGKSTVLLKLRVANTSPSPLEVAYDVGPRIFDEFGTSNDSFPGNNLFVSHISGLEHFSYRTIPAKTGATAPFITFTVTTDARYKGTLFEVYLVLSRILGGGATDTAVVNFTDMPIP